MNIDNIKEIINKIENKVILIGNRPYKRNINREILSNVNTEYDHQFETFSELIYLIKHKDNLENLHIFCPVCGKKNRFNGVVVGYTNYCSNKCSNNSENHKLKCKVAFLKRFGVDNPAKSKEILDKISNTKLKRYGDKYYTNQEKANETCLKRYGKQHYTNRRKAINTYFSKFGVKNPMQNKEVSSKAQETCMIRYGVNTFSKSELFKNLYKDNEFINSINNKRRTTSLIKYGLEDYTKTEECNIKRYKAKKKNGTLGGNRSEIEIKCYNKLKTKFADVQHSYYDKERYPFNCDMYIPCKDLFIECHFSQYHHYKPFDKNCIGDLAELSRLRCKLEDKDLTKKHIEKVRDVITTWTIRDPKKLATFKNNNLNFKIFYTEKEFNDWFNTL